MGWFDGLFGSKSTQDPIAKLDPKLREFLDKESPLKFKRDSDEPVAHAPAPGAQPSTTAPDPSAEPAVPTESLYKDGRYAHIWKTYKPLAAVEAESKTDQEQLMDVVRAYRERKATIGRAALENCAMEQLDWSNCMKAGSVAARMTMCRAEVKKFEKCYSTQTRLLKALGYLSTYDRPPEVEEEIQMHADAMYQKLVEQEAAIDAAKAEGRPIPQFPSLFPKQPDQGKAEADEQLPALTPEMEKQWKERLSKVAEADRHTEEAAMRAELRAKAEVASRLQGFWQGKEEERKSRKQEGKETISDRVSSLIGK